MGRSPCCETEAHRNKGTWTKEEDDILVNYIARHGQACWRSLHKADDTCGKSCRLRWINYLRPDLKRGNFTPQEEDSIIKLHAVLGNKWSLIAGRLPGRTDNEIKNYWNTHIRRKLLSRGINPQTHHPINSTTAYNNSLSLDLRSPTPSSSSTTEETQPYSHEQKATIAVDLELSIGHPSNSTMVPGQFCWAVARPPAKGVCLCWKLGLRDGELCSCQTKTGL